MNAVVPANQNAGTHTPAARLLGTLADGLCSHKRLGPPMRI